VPRKILVVDDDDVVCEITAKVFSSHGYRVRCAHDGFEALCLLKAELPDLIISDLNMPRMSGFEFLAVVRRRFPQIPTIAMSGEFVGPRAPAGVLADFFFEKGTCSPKEMQRKIAELLANPRVSEPPSVQRAPIWVPLHATSYYVLTCTDCLRSFPVSGSEAPSNLEEKETVCEYCGSRLRYRCELGLVGKTWTK
jgi:CheY-like chemotaxis protein